MLNMIVVAALALLASSARAQTPSYETISTGTVSGVYVSSQTPTRVDWLINGTTGQVLAGRTAIEVSISSAAGANINCGFDVLVSTISPSLTAAGGRYGLEYPKGLGPRRVDLPTNMGYWCLGQSVTAGVGISVKQVSPFRPR